VVFIGFFSESQVFGEIVDGTRMKCINFGIDTKFFVDLRFFTSYEMRYVAFAR